MALTIFEVVVAAGLVFMVGFLVVLFRDRPQQVCIIDEVSAHDVKQVTPPQPGERQYGPFWRKAAMFILPLFLIPSSLRAQSHRTGKLIPVDVRVGSAQQCR